MNFSNINDLYIYLKSNDLKKNMDFNNQEYNCLYKFMYYYRNKLKEFQKEIKKYNNAFITNDNIIVAESINNFINMNCDGKFLRGCLIDLGYHLTNKKSKYPIPLSIAYETFETSILIHDDIIDNASLRRNKPTIHSIYNSKLNDLETSKSLTICIGDLGFFYTNKIILDNYKNDKNLVDVLNYYNDIVIKTIKGEIIDVALPFLDQHNMNISSTKDVMEIYHLKTSWYTIIGPFILGMKLAGNNDYQELEPILNNLGIAFQIKDDILGIFGSNIGKSTSSDIEEYKQTILFTYVKENNKKYYQKLLKYYGQKNINNKNLEIVKNILIDSFAYQNAVNIMNKLFTKTKKELLKLNIKKEIKEILLGLTIYLELRDK